MPYCPSCGKEVAEDDRFCPHCGASTTREVRREVPQYRDERKACFGPSGSGSGLWGAISGGVFLIGLGVLWYFDWWWPGIIVLIGLMVIIGALVSYTRR